MFSLHLCPTELSATVKYICTAQMEVIGYIRLLSTLDVTIATEKLNFFILFILTH